MMSVPQIAAVAANAGFSGQDLVTAVAVSLAETVPPGNEQSYNPEQQVGAAPGQGSYGLWQIYLGKHPQFDPNQLMDPQYNANAAFALYSAAGGTFRDWATFKSGKYLSFVPQVENALAQMTPAPDQTPAPSDSAPALDGSLASFPTTDYLPVLLLAGGLLVWFMSRG